MTIGIGLGLVPPPLWTPARLPGLQRWWEADRILGLADGAAIASWPDRSKNLDSALQATGASQPLYKTSRLNGRSSVLFDGVNDYLTHTYTGEPAFMFLVGRETSKSGYRGWAGAYSATAGPPDAYYFAARDGSNRLEFARATVADGAGATDFHALTNAGDANYWRCQAGVITGTTIQTWINGELVVSDTTVSSEKTIDTASGAKNPVIGTTYYSDALANYLAGDICLLVIASTAPSAASRLALERYARQRYWGTSPRLSTYLFATWETGIAGLRLLSSSDGHTFSELLTSYVPQNSGTRDPTILRLANVWYIAHTEAIGTTDVSTAFTIAQSSDLRWWARTVRISLAGVLPAVNRVWSPEFFTDSDGSVHLIVAASTDAGTTFTFYETHPTVAGDFSAWSTPVAITGTGLPTGAYDPFILRIGSTYQLWYTNASNTNIEQATSTSLTSGYTVAHTGNWTGWGTAVEGVSIVALGGANYRAYFDHYSEPRVYYSESSDSCATWAVPVVITEPFTARHGTVVAVS